MKHKAPLLFSFVTALIFLVTSCQAPKDLVYRDFRNLSVNKLGFSSSTVTMDLIYYNPNNFGLQLKRTDLDIFIGDNYLGHTVQEYQVNIPKLGEFSIPISIDVDMKNLLKNAITSVFNDEIMVKITGSVKVGKANVYKSFQVMYEGKQKFSLFQ
jgi:LEA14-like dessication related protein